MSITFSCACGKSYTVDDSLAGKRTRCPVCRESLTVPEPVVEFEVAADEPEPVVEVAADDQPVVGVVGEEQESGFEVVDDEVEFGFEVVAEVSESGFEVVDDEVMAADDESAGLPAEVIEVSAESAAAGGGDPEKPEKPDWFLAYVMSALGASWCVIYRVYRVGDELLFIDAGPYHFTPSVAAGGGLVGGVAALIQAQRREKSEQRQKDLDKMSVKKLGREADKGKRNFRAAADEFSGARFDPKSLLGRLASAHDFVGVLQFKHRAKGSMKMQFIARRDLKSSVRIFTDFLGPGAVQVNVPVGKKKRDG